VGDFPPDAGLVEVLRSLGAEPDALLGRGGEAWVYALDGGRVVRVLHAGQDPRNIRARQALVDELGSRGAPFALPDVLDVGEVNGRWYAVERRLPGIAVSEQLPRLSGGARDRLVEHHLDTAARLRRLHLEPRGWFGELIDRRPVRSDSWRGFLRERAARNVRASTPDFRAVDTDALADAMPDASECAFVHLDAFAGNMLAERSMVTAVVDIGVTSVCGDPELDPLATAVYLCSEEITPVATRRDRDVAMSWLRAAGIADCLAPVRRWLAAYWCWAVDDEPTHEWCRSVLLHGA
jgi:aminoglycoside phosphotransferase (APT) family kinase protein